MTKLNKLCIISHSGGLDSTTLMAKALAEGYIVQPITFEYGQNHPIELKAQFLSWMELKARNPENLRDTINLSIGDLLGSVKAQYQSIRDSRKIEEKTELEYYTPFRNLVFSSLAAMVGEIMCLTEDIDELHVGIGVHKHSSESYKKDYWDITPEFVNSLNAIFQLNDGIKVSTYAPYASEFKEAIIRDAVDLDVPYKLTWTCYNPVETTYGDTTSFTPCLKCEDCLERQIQGLKADVDDINDYELNLEKITNL